ncbi:MAG TPA: AraC family transcriptional regulator [Clostridiaceae bacterium]
MNENFRSLYIPEDIVQEESLNLFLKNLIVIKLGYFGEANWHYVDRDEIEEYVIHFCIKGKGYLKIKDKDGVVSTRTIAIKEGDIFFCDKNTKHCYGSSLEDPWSVYWVHFKGDGVEALMDAIGFTKANPSCHVTDIGTLAHMFEEMFPILYTGYNFPKLLYISTCLQKLFAYIIYTSKHSLPNDVQDINIERIISFMHENVNRTFPLKEFSSMANMSLYHFVRIFKQKTGYPPIEYFNRIKIQKACQLLDTDNQSIKEIGSYLSFNNQYYFSNVFKKITGYSPKSYRTIRNNNLMKK